MKRAWWKNKLDVARGPAVTIVLMIVSVVFFMLIHLRGDTRSSFLDLRLYAYRMNFLDCFKAALAHKDSWHLCGSLALLWVLGFNLENRCGSWRFFVLAAMGGLIANGSHALLAAPIKHIPEIGLSGLVSFLMGSYFVFLMEQPLYVLIDISSFRKEFWVPPVFMCAIFSGIEILSGGTPLRAGESVFYAHVSGFIAGVGLSWLVRDAEEIKAYIQKALKKKKEP